MLQSGYAGLSDHIAEHRRLTQQVLDLQRDFVVKEQALPLTVLTFLSDWLGDHIKGSDRRYAPAVRRFLSASEAATA